ncbi:MAG: GTP cyclohydrolase FolE2 [Candidatus Porifericomitaceae bacterium WSBS_2022_MAG_OTU9]
MAQTANMVSIPDIQNSADTRKLPIDRVGIKDIRHPVVIADREGKQQHTIANFNMYVRLPHEFKGTHMSRFVELLQRHDKEITLANFREILDQMTDLLDADSGCVEMSFPFFMRKAAPISGVQSLMDYQVSFIGVKEGDTIRTDVRLVVPVTSLCPCSKEISKYGAHNQRSHIVMCLRLNSFIWIEDLIELAEKTGSGELYGLLKRPDEKYVTEYAYENPKFVEDIVRDLAVQFNKDDRISSYTVETENFESIHNHSAYAMISCDKSQQS